MSTIASALRREPGFYRKLLRLALPVVLQNLITTSLGFMDTFMVGLLGSEEMSAVTVANTPVFIMQLVSFGLISGSGVLISQYWGKDDHTAISRVLGIALYAAGGVSTLFALVTFFAPVQVLGLVTDNARLVALASPYLRIVGVSCFFDALATAYVGMQRSTENPVFGMAVFMISTAVNTIGNYLLIFGKLGAPALGVTGAATATLFARALEFLICAAYLLYDRRLSLVTRCVLVPGCATLRSFTRYALPVLLNETLWGTGTSMYAVIMGHMRASADVLAAYTVAGGVDHIIVAVEFGLAAAAGVVIGKEIGMGNRARAQEIGIALCVVSLGVGLCIAALEQLLYWMVLSPFLLPLFRLPPLAARVCTILICCYSILSPVVSLANVLVVGILRAGGDVRMSMLIDIGPLWCVTIPLLALMALLLDAPLLLICLVMSSEALLKVPFGLWRLCSGKWMRDVTE